MGKDRFAGAEFTPEMRLDSARGILKKTGIDGAAKALCEVASVAARTGVRLESTTGNIGIGYIVDPVLRLVGDWYPNGSASMQTDRGVFDGTINQRATVTLTVPAKQVDQMGGGKIVMGGFIETNMDCIAGDDLAETEPVKTRFSPVDLSVPGLRVWRGDADPEAALAILKYAVHSGLIPEDRITDVYDALALKGYHLL